MNSDRQPARENRVEQRPPLPPFDLDSAVAKVQAAEDAWNTRDPHRVALAYTEDSVWRNRDTFITGREQIVAFLTSKWERELDYVLRKSLWGFRGNRIAVRFQYEWHDGSGQWFRSYGNELWEFTPEGLMSRRGGEHQRRRDRGVRTAVVRASPRAGARRRPLATARHPAAVTGVRGRRRRTAWWARCRRGGSGIRPASDGRPGGWCGTGVGGDWARCRTPW
ncbi:nuclear transport factor 2 family protein [Actinocatenispora sera]|uniref:DUF4440 domain-containing protein n=1 Tax=Actinocatenispora sera TaxID=390989 RepID=A0A810LC82_9ACTN|nr:nuclear transport factor 2 family protein [Actinocatenispora sera]BCJ31856.1 hypothetical protein Asera_59640 [Actinocatenispora sera]